MEDKPVMVIYDECLFDKKFDLTLVAKVNSFDSMPNLGVVFKDEGFENVNIRYLGGLWVSLKFMDYQARDCFKKHKGIPLVAWTNKTFMKVAKRWGELLFSEDSDDNNLWRKRLCVVTKVEDFIMESFKIIIKGKVTVVRACEIIRWIPDFLEEENDINSDSGDDDSEKSVPHTDICSGVKGNGSIDCDGKREMDFTKGDDGEEKSDDPFGIYNLLNQRIKIQKLRMCDNDLVLPKGKSPRMDSSLLEKMNEFVEIGQAMGFSMEGCLGPKAKKQWVQELCCKNKICFLSLQETKIEEMDDNVVRSLWGNMDFEFRHSPSVGESIMMGDFNEVRVPSKRYGSVFNKQGASVFNAFINSLSLIDVNLGSFSFTWALKNATKMSKLDRFLVSEGLLCQFPAMTGLILTRHLSDHRPILLKECDIDYGLIPFKMFHSWFDIEGFDQMKKINSWVQQNRVKVNERRKEIQEKLHYLDKQIDQDGGQEDMLNSRRDLWKDLWVLDDLREKDLVQKAK
ncbi:RNA-directed DNA polymerase, eukaryota, partial [Tanacetum coccineum]